MSIIVDPEFESLIPSLSEEEFKQLEENCVRYGVREPLVLWPQNDSLNNILIDGHNRFKIIAKHMLPYKETFISFKDRDEAKQWIILNQFGRRNLSAYDRSVLALKLKPVISAQAKERQAKAGRGEDVQKSAQAKTRDELAAIAGVSHDTIHKVETIEQKATPKTKELVREGKLSINQAYLSTRSKKETPIKEAVKQAKEEHEAFLERSNDKVISFNDLEIDRANRELLKADLQTEVMKLLNEVQAFGVAHEYNDLDGVFDDLPDDEKEIMTQMCVTAIRVLHRIKDVFRR